MIEQIFFGALGIALLVLTFKLVHKEKYSFAFFVFIVAVVSFLLTATWFQGLMKTGVISTVASTLKLYGNRLDDFQTTITSMGNELSEHQTQIKAQQKVLSDQETKIQSAQTNVAAQQESITNQYQQISAVQSDLATAQTNLNLQAAKIQDVEFLVDNLFSKTFAETLYGSDSNKITVINNKSGSQTVIMKLEYVPVLNSIHAILVANGIQAPMLPFLYNYKNIISADVTGIDVRNGKINLQYVIDSRETNLVKNVEIRGKQVFYDNYLVNMVPEKP